jgi:hypothetical protein
MDKCLMPFACLWVLFSVDLFYNWPAVGFEEDYSCLLPAGLIGFRSLFFSNCLFSTSSRLCFTLHSIFIPALFLLLISQAHTKGFAFAEKGYDGKIQQEMLLSSLSFSICVHKTGEALSVRSTACKAQKVPLSWCVSKSWRLSGLWRIWLIFNNILRPVFISLFW